MPPKLLSNGKPTLHHQHQQATKGFFRTTTLLYLVGFGCFVHVFMVRPQPVVVRSDNHVVQPVGGGGQTTSYNPYNGPMDRIDGEDVAYLQDDDLDVLLDKDPQSMMTSGINPPVVVSKPCPAMTEKKATSIYKQAFAAEFPVEAGQDHVTDWDAIPCAHIPRNCNLKNNTWGYPFIMISFGRSGTTSTWDIIAGLTGEYIPRATEDMGKDKGSGREFFAAQNQTEHGKCWLERLLCGKQREARQAFKQGLGKSSIFGSKWKPWHQGLNTTQARQALQWLGAMKKHIKVLHNTRNMVDMYISKNKHTILEHLFGAERTAHCYDDRELTLSETTWTKLEAMGISRDTPCAQIFKLIEQRTKLDVRHMLDYFEKNVLQTDFASEMLDYYDVDRVTVTYEKLYFTESAEEWMRIFRYLGFGPQHNLTLDDVFAKTAFQKTSANDRSKRMANYDEVSEALKCTRYAEYLD